MGTSLWLVPFPSSPEAAALEDVIISLSKRHGSPSFPPHVTLASLPACISLPEVAACLLSKEAPEISFATIRTGPTFFQSVFIVVQTSLALTSLHEHVHKTLGVQPKTPEFAHLSLYYGDSGKVDIAHALWIDGVVHADSQGVSVGGIHEFVAGEVWVVSCQGMPDEWIVLEKIPLKVQ